MRTISRRSWLKRNMGAAIGGMILGPGGFVWSEEPPEEEISDPGATPEFLKFDPAVAEAPLAIVSKGPPKDHHDFATKMVDISLAYAAEKVSRDTAPNKIDNFLRLFGLHLRDEKGKYVPFCAAGLSFAACQAYCEIAPTVSYDKNDASTLKATLTDINKYYFKPSPAVRVIKADAIQKKTWVKPGEEAPKKGWPVLFSWNRDGTPNHIGLVEGLQGETLHTVEYNTSPENQSNGGTVARRERKLSFVLGYVKTW